MYVAQSPNDLGESQQWIVESGLYSAISGGDFSTEAVA